MFIADLRWSITRKVELFFTESAAWTDAAFDPLVMGFAGDVPVALFPDGLPGPGDDPTAPLGDADYDFGAIDNYSKLKYTEQRATLGIDVQPSKNIGLYAAVSYYDIDDGQPYLRSSTGSVLLFSGALSWKF